MTSLTPASLRAPAPAGIPRVDDRGPQIVDAEVPPAGRFVPTRRERMLPAVEHGPQMHLLLLPVVAIAVVGWLVSRVVHRVKDKKRPDRDPATDRNPDDGDRSPES
jgi:hypothetical protein